LLKNKLSNDFGRKYQKSLPHTITNRWETRPSQELKQNLTEENYFSRLCLLLNPATMFTVKLLNNNVYY